MRKSLVFHQHFIIHKASCGYVTLGNADAGFSGMWLFVIIPPFSNTMLILVSTGKVYSCYSFVMSTYVRLRKKSCLEYIKF